MNIFWKLLEAKTWKTDLLIKAVYLANASISWKGSYFIYYYDIFTHTFFINDVDNNSGRTSAMKIIENIVNKAYKQEMNSLAPLLQKIQMNKKPQIVCMHIDNTTNDVVLDKVHLEAVRWVDLTIIWFRKSKSI